jgi:hypothetical protein
MIEIKIVENRGRDGCLTHRSRERGGKDSTQGNVVGSVVSVSVMQDVRSVCGWACACLLVCLEGLRDPGE